jgi:uncharacterized cupredoxin-like copper-binding protein
MRGRTVSALVLAATVYISGCGSGTSQPVGPRVPIKEHDFKIAAPATLPPGKVDLSVDNTGPDDHELIVARVSGGLPRRADGLTVDEDAIEKQTVGALEPGMGSRDVVVNLRPGRYIMFCNMQGHYLGGMHRVVQVR